MMGRSPRRFELIVFDWDGTLYDSTALIVQALRAACADVGQPVPGPEAASHVIGLGLHEALRQVAPGLPAAQIPELVAAYRVHYLAQQQGLSLFPGTVELLEGLRARGHRLAIATGKSRRGLDEVLERPPGPDAPPGRRLGHYFDASRTADETHSKPHPRMLLELIDHFGVRAEHTLMVGDTSHDLQLAANAGTAALAVGYGAHPPESLHAFGPLAVLPSMQALDHWLRDHA